MDNHSTSHIIERTTKPQQVSESYKGSGMMANGETVFVGKKVEAENERRAETIE